MITHLPFKAFLGKRKTRKAMNIRLNTVLGDPSYFDFLMKIEKII